MLGVEEDPVEPAIGDGVGSDVATQATPQADLQTAFGECGFEWISDELH